MTYLAIEKDDMVHKRESKFWASRNILSTRVLSMGEGIEEASKNEFLYIGINDDNIDYLPSLSLLREVTTAPILISTTSFTNQKHCKALQNGADLFAPLSENPNENFDSVMEKINRLNDFAKQKRPPIELIYGGGILISQTHHKIFVDDKEIELTPMDFILLYYLMSRRGQLLSAEQIYSSVWKGCYNSSEDEVVKSAIKRLRKKINKQNSEHSVIKNIRGLGYIFTA
jgi:two-component system response regulator VanR